MSLDTQGGHLESGDVAAYLDRTLRAGERDRIERHLAECADCRREVIEVSRVRGTRPRRWLIVAPAVAAAAVLILFLARTSATPEGPVFRGGDDSATTNVVLATPAEGAAVARDGIRFAWRRAAGASYRLTVTDARGDVVWSQALTDTSALPPDSIVLRGGVPYHWYVDALLPDGRSVASGVRSFTVRP